MVSFVRGIALLRLVLMNKGTAFTEQERVELGLDGLLPSQVCSLEDQIVRAYNSFKRQPNALSKYQFLRGLQERQEILFYALISEHLEEMMPVIYTPTVGDAVANFSSLYENPRGLSVSPQNVSRIDKFLEDYPLADTRLIVATDSSAILGIGDQGYGGLAISIGKLALYTVGGGISPFHSMPVCLDVGTDTQHLLDDPLYVGARQPRMQGDAYLEFVDQFVAAVKRRWPKVILQWEDLSKEAAFKVLERYRDEIASFNDDIQGTGAVALGGILSACRVKRESMVDQRFLVYGAGAGGIGVAWAIRQGLIRSGLSDAEAMERVFVFDSRGLLLSDRDMVEYKRPFARDVSTIADWDFSGDRPTVLETIANAKITGLIGLSGQAGAFGADWVRAVHANTERPMIFALSNPTVLSEGKPADFLEWTQGAALVATGSPFDDVILDGRTHYAAQGNNAFIFPGLGAGAMLCEARSITDGMIMEAADALARYTGEVYPDGERIYPELSHLRRVSQAVAAAVIRQAIADGVARVEVSEDAIAEFVENESWEPRYLPVRAAAES
ncbi:MAG: NAD-dependent malic enzyme [Myxococcota bacterium]|nr:NAD-dependent malic enzyme [Myxococcota bacterium]